MGIDLARAVAGAVADLLRSHLLPVMCAAGDRALWLHLADEAVTFERRWAGAASHAGGAGQMRHGGRVLRVARCAHALSRGGRAHQAECGGRRPAAPGPRLAGWRRCAGALRCRGRLTTTTRTQRALRTLRRCWPSCWSAQSGGWGAATAAAAASPPASASPRPALICSLLARRIGQPTAWLFCRRPFQDAWLGAELADAERQLEAAVDAPGAWKRAQHGLAGAQLGGGAGGDEDDALATPRSVLSRQGSCFSKGFVLEASARVPAVDALACFAALLRACPLWPLGRPSRLHEA